MKLDRYTCQHRRARVRKRRQGSQEAFADAIIRRVEGSHRWAMEVGSIRLWCEQQREQRMAENNVPDGPERLGSIVARVVGEILPPLPLTEPSR